MKAHWKVPESRPLADFAPTFILTLLRKLLFLMQENMV